VVGSQFAFGSEAKPLSFQKMSVGVSEVLARQAEFLKNRRTSLVNRRVPGGGMKKMKKRHEAPKTSKALTIQESWLSQLAQLQLGHPDFFSSDEAILKNDGKVSRGQTAYRGLPLSQHNNSDLREIFEIEFEAKAINGQSTASYEQFATVLGQYMRLCVVLGHVDEKVVFERGMLYSSIVNRDALRALLNYFFIRGAASTVMTKALHLKKLAEMAVSFFESEGNKEMRGHAELSLRYLRSEFNVHKQRSREMAVKRKNIEDRIARGVIFLPADFRRCTLRACRKLDGIISGYRKICASRSETEAGRFLKEHRRALDKWCLNFLVLLILSAGGQRPQVFALLKRPSAAEVLEMEIKSEEGNFFEIRVSAEKTRRSIDLPNVMFPRSVLPYVQFHVEVVLNLLEEQAIDSETEDWDRLVVHSRTMKALTTHQVTDTLQRFLRDFDANLHGVTTMALRGSYATMMLRAYRDGKIFPNSGEEEFLAILARAMNTSVEQLKSTYVACDKQDFVQSACELVSALEVVVEEEESIGAAVGDGKGDSEHIADFFTK